ncbi:hypothetical protein [Paracoccus shanxieyensis]|uniref:Uncharacterized protein n=1 Tax=Paracoccus shanxieyensis TaxID=2675752 RepID=A0A6L6J0M9_9RHOB|nr:hypothetical protein [Paracoccus shanxieyensis]MTH64227.1 hypothetical protein [Paracoccus shanxieyensis]MTH87371.1 hypothetical protein [Paracoccus shanxieyensis]
MAQQELKKEMPHTKNPDMIAFTVGRITLQLMQSGVEVSTEQIHWRLADIVRNGHQGGVTPEMAKGALLALGDLQSAQRRS